MGMFDWIKQLEDNAGQFLGNVGHAIGGAVQNVEHAAAPVVQNVEQGVQNAVHAGSDVLHGNLGGAFNDLLAKYGEQNHPTAPPPKPLFNFQPVGDFLNTALRGPIPALTSGVERSVASAFPGSSAPPTFNSTTAPISAAIESIGKTGADLTHSMLIQPAVQAPLRVANQLSGNSYDPTGPLEKYLLGDQPVGDLTDYGRQGIDAANAIPGVHIDSQNIPAPLATALGGVLAGLDATPFGLGKAKVVSLAGDLAKANDAASVSKVLATHIGEDAAGKVSPAALHTIAAETDPKKIQSILQAGPSPAQIDLTSATRTVKPSHVPGVQAVEKAPVTPTLTKAATDVRGLMQASGLNDFQLEQQAKAAKNDLIRKEMGNMVAEIRAGKVTQGSLNRTADGVVVGRTGRQSTNPEWYRALHQGNEFNVSKKGIESAIANARPNSKLYAKLQSIAESRLRGEYSDPMIGPIPANKTFVGAEHVLKGIKDHRALPPMPSAQMERWVAMGGKPEDFPYKTAEEMAAEGAPAKVKVSGPKIRALNDQLTPELHQQPVLHNTPNTPALSATHLDMPDKAPIDLKRPKIKLAPPTKESGINQTLGSIGTIIRHQGNAGKELFQRMLNVRREHARLGQSFRQSTPTVYKLDRGRILNGRRTGGKEFNNFVDVVHGQAAPINAKVAKAVTEWQAFTQRAEQLARDNSAMKAGHIENYFPRMYDNKLFTDQKTWEKAINHLVNTGQASDIQDAVGLLNSMREPSQGGHRFGALDKARTANLPGFRRDIGVIRTYQDRVARRVAEARQFGSDNEHVDRLIGQMAQEGKDANAAQEAFNAYWHAPKTGLVASAANAARKGSNVLTLSKAAISHSTQTSNTAIVTGIVRTAHAWIKSLNPADRAYIKSLGINYAAHDGRSVSSVAPFLKQMRAQNRIVSALAGKYYGEALARAGKVDELKRLGVQGNIGRTLTRDQSAQMSHIIADKTQFSDDPMDLPAWGRTAGGKLVGQYRMSYQYKQGGFLFNQIIKEAKAGNIAPALRALAVIPAAGAGVVEAKHLLGSKTDPTDPLADAEAGGLGTIPTSIATSFKFMHNGEQIATGLAGDVAPLAGQIVQTGFNVYKAMQGNPKALEKQGLGYIPFIGTLVKNAVFPSTPADPNAIAYAQGEAAGLKSLTSSKDQGVWNALYGSNKDAAGNKIPAVYDPNNSPFVAEALLAHPAVLAAATEFYKHFHAATGQAIDPLYDLTPDQQIAALNIRAAAAFPGELSADKKQLETELPADYRAQQDAYYASVAASLAAAGKGGGLPGAPAYPTPSADVQALLNAGNTKDPSVQAWLDQLAAYNNQKRNSMGLPQIAPYGYAPNDGQIPNPSNPYAKKAQPGGTASSTFSAKASSGGRRATGKGSRGGKIAIRKGAAATKVKAVKIAKIKMPTFKASPVVKVAKVRAAKPMKPMLARTRKARIA